jgi:fucose permease
VPVTIVALAFAALGLPDGALGVAWPSARRDFGLPVSGFGVLIIIMMGGHLLASVGSGPAAARVGPARLLLWANVAFTASALGFAFAPGWWGLMVAGLVAGAAGGLIDAGLNAYAAARFSPAVMTSLHACFGAGATLGPLLMGRVLEQGRSWRAGYGVIAGALVAMTLALALVRRALDENGAADDRASDRAATALPSVPRLAETLRQPGVWLGAVLFCLYTGLEATPGRWAYSLLAEARGMAPERAAIAAAAYWGSMSVGRASWGLAARWLAPRLVLRGCLACAPVGALLVWTGAAGPLAIAGFVILGLCFAPIFPLLTALTADRVGAEHAGHAIGLQVAAASLGGGVLPGGIGLVARRTGLEVLGPFLLVTALVTLALYHVVERRTTVALSRSRRLP